MFGAAMFGTMPWAMIRPLGWAWGASGVSKEGAKYDGEREGERESWVDVFQACPTFKGPRPGFVFTTGARGTGYYKDELSRKRSRDDQGMGPRLPSPLSIDKLGLSVDGSSSETRQSHHEHQINGSPGSESIRSASEDHDDGLDYPDESLLKFSFLRRVSPELEEEEGVLYSEQVPVFHQSDPEEESESELEDSSESESESEDQDESNDEGTSTDTLDSDDILSGIAEMFQASYLEYAMNEMKRSDAVVTLQRTWRRILATDRKILWQVRRKIQVKRAFLRGYVARFKVPCASCKTKTMRSNMVRIGAACDHRTCIDCVRSSVSILHSSVIVLKSGTKNHSPSLITHCAQCQGPNCQYALRSILPGGPIMHALHIETVKIILGSFIKSDQKFSAPFMRLCRDLTGFLRHPNGPPPRRQPPPMSEAERLRRWISKVLKSVKLQGYQESIEKQVKSFKACRNLTHSELREAGVPLFGMRERIITAFMDSKAPESSSKSVSELECQPQHEPVWGRCKGIIEFMKQLAVRKIQVAVRKSFCNFQKDCAICCETLHVSNLLPCHHDETKSKTRCRGRYCSGCHQRYLEPLVNGDYACVTSIKGKYKLTNIWCMHHECDNKLYLQDIQRHLPGTSLPTEREMIRKVQRHNIKGLFEFWQSRTNKGFRKTVDFVNDDNNVRACPKCYAIIHRYVGCDDMNCVCSHRFNMGKAQTVEQVVRFLQMICDVRGEVGTPPGQE